MFHYCKLPTWFLKRGAVKLICDCFFIGGISLGLNWVCAVLYSLLNICTSASVGSSDALSLINSLFKEKCTHSLNLNALHFISSPCASSLHTEEWVHLVHLNNTNICARFDLVLLVLSREWNVNLPQGSSYSHTAIHQRKDFKKLLYEERLKEN